jgi:hypothetical protein
MVATLLYETDAEKRLHLSAIHALAMHSGIAEDFVRQIYENELKALKQFSRIKDFLPILVAKRIKGNLISSGDKIR